MIWRLYTWSGRRNNAERRRVVVLPQKILSELVDLQRGPAGLVMIQHPLGHLEDTVNDVVVISPSLTNLVVHIPD